MTTSEERLLEQAVQATERVADSLLVLAYVTGQFDVGTDFGVQLRNAVRDRACFALGIDPPPADEAQP